MSRSRRMAGGFGWACFVLVLAEGMTPVQAQVELDNSLTASGTPPRSVNFNGGSDYEITENEGAVRNSNRFHSFSSFSLGQWDSATFKHNGFENITNVLVRVTGDSQSNINGLLKCTIGGANFFLANLDGTDFSQTSFSRSDGTIDRDLLRGILRGQNWDRAVYDAAVYQELRKLDGSSGHE